MVLAPPVAGEERSSGRVQKLVACGFNVPPDALQKGGRGQRGGERVPGADSLAGAGDGRVGWGTKWGLCISQSAGAAQLRRQLRQFDCP